MALNDTKSQTTKLQAGDIKEYENSSTLNAEQLPLKSTKKPNIECRVGGTKKYKKAIN